MDGFSADKEQSNELPRMPHIPEPAPDAPGVEIGNGYDEEPEPASPYDEALAEGILGASDDLVVQPEGEEAGDVSETGEDGGEAPEAPEEVAAARPQVTEYRGETEVMPSGFPRTDLYDRVKRLGLPADEVVLVGSGAVEAVVGPDARRAADIDLAVSEGLYRHLREQPGIEEVMWPGGDPRLKGEGIDVGVGWAGRSVDELRQGGYTNEGVQVAGLPDVYAYKQERGEPKDHADLTILRNRLYGDKPLPPGMLKGETEFLNGIVPAELHGRPELHVAANGLYVVRTVFGDEGAGVRTYSGTVEQGNVPATYHAWHHTANGLRGGQQNMSLANAEAAAEGRPEPYDDSDRLAHAAGYGNHDVILGHGRQAMNRTGHDERQAADLAVRHLEAAGVTHSPTLEKTHATIMATTFNEARKAQDIDPERGNVPAQEMGAGSDMSAFRRADALLGAARLIPEDFSRIGAGYDEPLTRLTRELNANLQPGQEPVRIRSARDGMRLIDQYPDYPVTKTNPDGTQEVMTLAEAAARHLEGSGGFMEKFEFPASWKLGTKQQQLMNASLARDTAARYRRGEITAEQVLDIVEEYARIGGSSFYAG
jgi:hypothetical protein